MGDSDKAAYGVVLGYLKKQNRPYSVIDITTNLGKEHNKAAVTRVLDRMVKENKVIEKIYGKQKIYYINQALFDEASDVDMKQMDSEITNLTTTLKELTGMISKTEKEVTALSKSMTTSEAKAELEKINAELPAQEQRLESLRKQVVKVDPKEKAALHSANEKCTSAWRKRKRLATDMIEAILESYPKTKKDLMEEIGIERDEDVK